MSKTAALNADHVLHVFHYARSNPILVCAFQDLAGLAAGERQISSSVCKRRGGSFTGGPTECIPKRGCFSIAVQVRVGQVCEICRACSLGADAATRCETVLLAGTRPQHGTERQ